MSTVTEPAPKNSCSPRGDVEAGLFQVWGLMRES